MEKYRFYKYAVLDTYTLTNLINSEIYFNKVSNFDDPTDSAYIIQTGDKNISADDLSQEKLEQLFDLMDIPFEKGKSKRHLDDICRILEKSLKKYIGVFCITKHNLCKKCNFPEINPIMLSQYADHHKGLIIEYECYKPEIVRRIVYESTYKHFECDAILNNFNAGFMPRRVSSLNDAVLRPLLFKFKEWAYQNEYRIFSYLPGYTQPINNFELKITRIYFGERIDRHIGYTVKKLVQNENIEIFSLHTPRSHNTNQRICISEHEGTQHRNCEIKCNFLS